MATEDAGIEECPSKKSVPSSTSQWVSYTSSCFDQIVLTLPELIFWGYGRGCRGGGVLFERDLFSIFKIMWSCSASTTLLMFFLHTMCVGVMYTQCICKLCDFTHHKLFPSLGEANFSAGQIFQPALWNCTFKVISQTSQHSNVCNLSTLLCSICFLKQFKQVL